MTNDKKESMYLDYVNNFLTLKRFAEYHGIDIDEAATIIQEGREINNNK
jgi:hypothetical protein